jgi:hypothetical protein
MDALVVCSLLGASFWNMWCLEGSGGGAVFIYRVDDGGSQRRWAAGSRRQTCLGGLVQGGDAVWSYGGVYNRHVEYYADHYPKDVA